MAQTKEGALKAAATKYNIPFDEYMNHINSGEKYCNKCKMWKSSAEFYRESARYDGKAVYCAKCRRVKNPTYGRGRHNSKEHKEKIGKGVREYWKTHTHPTKGKVGPRLGIKHTAETRKKISDIARERTPRGKDHYNYNGGPDTWRTKTRELPKYRDWRRAVYERDNYTCRHCGDNRGGNLNAHHIKSWADHAELRCVVSNGITLCKKCHRRVHRAV